MHMMTLVTVLTFVDVISSEFGLDFGAKDQDEIVKSCSSFRGSYMATTFITHYHSR